MKAVRILLQAAIIILVFSFGLAVRAADYPAPKEGDWIARDFRFHTGEIIPELRLHYTTIGNPSGEPVLILHGTTMSGTAMLLPTFAGELFGPGQAWTQAGTTSSCRTLWATANQASRQMGCAQSFLPTTTMTWSLRSMS